jgi:hypothetical protein
MSNQKRSKLSIGCLIAAGILATICGIAVPISALSAIFSPAPVPTLDTNAIATYAFQTALAANQGTQAASGSTIEPTVTNFPIEIEPQALWLSQSRGFVVVRSSKARSRCPANHLLP